MNFLAGKSKIQGVFCQTSHFWFLFKTIIIHAYTIDNATFNNISVIPGIVEVSHICGGNRSVRGKPPICRKSLINFIT